MRMLMVVRLPHDRFNQAVKDGSAERKMKAILDEVKPEAVYFTELDGRRTIVFITEFEKASMIPAVNEAWFITFSADVEVHPVLTSEDMAEAGLEDLGKKWG